jgi:hypothetical protein
MTWHLYRHGIDQDNFSKYIRDEQSHLHGDPAANGIANHCDLFQLELLDQLRLHPRQAFYCIQFLRSLSPCKSGMSWGDHSYIAPLNQQISKTCYRRGPSASMQQKKGSTLAPFLDAQIKLGIKWNFERRDFYFSIGQLLITFIRLSFPTQDIIHPDGELQKVAPERM